MHRAPSPRAKLITAHHLCCVQVFLSGRGKVHVPALVLQVIATQASGIEHNFQSAHAPVPRMIALSDEVESIETVCSLSVERSGVGLTGR